MIEVALNSCLNAAFLSSRIDEREPTANVDQVDFEIDVASPTCSSIFFPNLQMQVN